MLTHTALVTENEHHYRTAQLIRARVGAALLGLELPVSPGTQRHRTLHELTASSG